jgi:hypothetical protein
VAEFPVRRLLLGLVLLGICGLIAELLLLGHTESFSQWMPLMSLAAGLVATIAVWVRPGATTVGAFRIIMFVFVAAGLLGVYFHFAGNIEWALERDPELSGLSLIWKALKGATPSLAPGALAQLGLLGLIFAWTQPDTQSSSSDTSPPGDRK